MHISTSKSRFSTLWLHIHPDDSISQYRLYKCAEIQHSDRVKTDKVFCFQSEVNARLSDVLLTAVLPLSTLGLHYSLIGFVFRLSMYKVPSWTSNPSRTPKTLKPESMSPFYLHNNMPIVVNFLKHHVATFVKKKIWEAMEKIYFLNVLKLTLGPP